MLGESKRDYPAAIGYQSPWYKEYKYIEDHFSRLNVALTRGKPVTRVAVIHPIESFWLTYGPADRNGADQAWRDQAVKDLTEWLLLGLIDFDFVSESLFPDQTRLNDIQMSSLSEKLDTTSWWWPSSAPFAQRPSNVSRDSRPEVKRALSQAACPP